MKLFLGISIGNAKEKGLSLTHYLTKIVLPPSLVASSSHYSIGNSTGVIVKISSYYIVGTHTCWYCEHILYGLSRRSSSVGTCVVGRAIPHTLIQVQSIGQTLAIKLFGTLRCGDGGFMFINSICFTVLGRSCGQVFWGAVINMLDFWPLFKANTIPRCRFAGLH